MDYSRPGLADRLAADYVTGTLRGPARRRIEALLPAHPVLREAVRDWQSRLMPLTLSIVPEAPPPVVWQRIQSSIGAPAVPLPADRKAWWQRLAVWQGLSAFATLAALSFAVLLATPGPARPPVVVVLSPTGAPQGAVVPASFVASISGDGRTVVTKPLINVGVAPDRALELWAIPGSGAPRSLGLISAEGTTVVKRGEALAGATALAVSLEPPGGSPTGAPTGPVLFAGKLQI